MIIPKYVNDSKHKHIDLVCKRANSTLKRNFSSCNSKMKADAYQIYICPILEFAVCSWASHTRCNINKLESVQRRAARFVTGDYRYISSVTDMINTLEWNSLHSRRDTLRLQNNSLFNRFKTTQLYNNQGCTEGVQKPL